MPSYLYRCPVHGQFTKEYPMGAAPPTITCGICKRECGRVYQAMPVQYHSPGFTRSLPDRPDERLDREIKHSMDFDALTGKSWEETDREMERKKAKGIVRKKELTLP